MPRAHSSELLLDSPSLRQYLRHACPSTGDQILDDAFRHNQAGAAELLRLGLAMRGNVRTVRTPDDFRAEWLRGRYHAKWYLDARGRLLALFRSLRKWVSPNAPHTDPRLRLPRGAQRIVAGSGAVRVNRTTLKQQATRQARRILQQTQGAQLVLWLDNHYLERFGTEPGADVLSQNVTAMAVLPIDRLTGSRQTRSVRWSGYPGHPEVTDLVDAVQSVLGDLARDLPAFIRKAGSVAALHLSRAELRVPLDVQRGTRPRLRWEPFDVSQLQVGANEDLVRLLQDACDLQGHSGCPLPLLVDENIHHRVARMLYGSPYKRWNLGRELRNLPLLYGVWHAYKHTVTLVYRAYFPVLVHLDWTVEPRSRGTVTNKRKVLYMEKMFAALYLNAADLLPLARDCMRLPATGARHPDQASSSRDPVDPTVEATTVRVALCDLLEFYAPALLRLGFLVRQCTWQGGPQGTVKGDTAQHILRACLLLQVHLQQDWEAEQEYTRTLAVALLMWQPWKSALPGCAFVEESCEALLSRYAGACRHNQYLSGYEDAWRLFVTLRQSSETAPPTRGSVRQELVLRIRDRARSLLLRPDGRPYPLMQTVAKGQWLAHPPAGFGFPGRPPNSLDRGRWLQVLQSALAVLSVGADPAARVAARLDAFADDVNHHVLADRRHCHERLRRWWEARRTRLRIATAIQRPPRAGRPKPPAQRPGDGPPLPDAQPHDAEEAAEEVLVPDAPSQASTYRTDSEGPLQSEDYHSPGDTEGLGSVGDVEVSDASASEGTSTGSEEEV